MKKILPLIALSLISLSSHADTISNSIKLNNWVYVDPQALILLDELKPKYLVTLQQCYFTSVSQVSLITRNVARNTPILIGDKLCKVEKVVDLSNRYNVRELESPAHE